MKAKRPEVKQNSPIRIPFLLIFIIVAAIVLPTQYPMNQSHFTSFSEYLTEGGEAYVSLPEGATNVRYYLHNPIISKQSVYSFTLTDPLKYDEFMLSLKSKICTPDAAASPAWDRYLDSDYSTEEILQMDEVEKNYQNMPYQELLEKTKHNKGFANGYGAAVTDYCDLLHSIDNFPEDFPFSKVIDDPITDYRILYYKPQGGSRYSEGVLVNEATKTFVVYRADGFFQ